MGSIRCEQLREDEVECEEAVAHLLACCEGSSFSEVSCLYVKECVLVSGGGCEPEHYDPCFPDIGSRTSRCLRDLSCTEIRDRGGCDAEDYAKVCR